MTIYRKRYPQNWRDIALKIKRKAKWTCQRCGLKCLKPNHDRLRWHASR